MKKFLLTLAVFCATMFSVFADGQPIPVIFKPKTPRPIGSGVPGRAPINLPIEVTFDDETGILAVSAPEDLEGSVYVYSVSGALEGSSQTLNATFTLTTPGLHVISLQGENWIGEGKIIL
ncbi:MAG: hypothetical protein K2M31_01870 [Muribaculaceae bacterium]|nr:hypothetical protein [Muribaculaceae bacterium]